jgi:hypothetical protein
MCPRRKRLEEQGPKGLLDRRLGTPSHVPFLRSRPKRFAAFTGTNTSI